MNLVKEGDYFRTYYGYNNETKGGLIDNPECVMLSDKCMVLDNAILRNHAWISGNAKVRDDAIMEDYAHAGQNVVISGKSHIKGHVCFGTGSANEPVIVVDNIDIDVHPMLFLSIHKLCIATNAMLFNRKYYGYSANISPRVSLGRPNNAAISVTVAFRQCDGIDHYKVLQDVAVDEKDRMKADGWDVLTGSASQTSEKLKQWLWKYSKL